MEGFKKIMSILIIVISILIIAACTFAFIIYGSFKLIGGSSISNQKSEQLKQEMNEHLNKKYGMEFEFVQRPKLVGNEGFGYNTYQAKAIPKGQPELEFIVAGDKSTPGVYVDYYLKSKWSNEGKNEIEKTIKEVYGSETDFILKYEFNFNDKEFKDLSHMQVLDKCKPYVIITYDIFSDEKFDKNKEAEKAYKTMKPYLYDNKINNYMFIISFYSKEYKQKYIALNGRLDEKSWDTLHNEGLYINYLNIDGHVEIKNAIDLVQYFKY